MGIFRRSKIDRVYPESDESSNLTTTLVKDNVMKSGKPVTFMHVRTVDVRDSSIAMPTKDEFSLEEQLKAGVRPEAINVSGMLGSDDSFDVNSALNQLYSNETPLGKSEEVNSES